MKFIFGISIRKVVAILSINFLTLGVLFGCSEKSKSTSEINVTDIDHTIVKRQSIGNCWLYAQASWIESLYKQQYKEDIDVSESYLTWWHWYDQIVGSNNQEVETGGWFFTANEIVLAHGFVLEGEFLSIEKDTEMSIAQATALSYINKQLKEGGTLARPESRTAENVRKELDIAFGSNMATTEIFARKASNIIVRKNNKGETTTMDKALSRTEEGWDQVNFPALFGEDTVVSPEIETARNEIMQRVLKALNDEWPVVMSLMIDFNALDVKDQTFKASKVREKGIGSQGGHLVVLDDYMVGEVPGLAPPQIMGEGNYGKEYRHLALKGKIMHLRAKNSWGKNRPDRGLTDGYTRFDWEYLSSQLEWKWGDSAMTSRYTTLKNFVLPPGY